MEDSPKVNACEPAVFGIGIFWVFASCMAALAGTMLIWPGTALDRLWSLNEPAHVALAPVRRLIGPVFLLLSTMLGITAVGWFKHRMWAWRMAVVIISAQVVGDFVNLVRGDFLRGCVGVIIAGGLLFYLLRSRLLRMGLH